ncbi:MAG: FAD-dependent oxidoreductase, partial [Bacteroidota bacterium]
PLMGGYTSIGIVAAEKYHDFSTFNTKEKAIEWLKNNEPFIAEKVIGKELINFSLLKNYSYSSREVFSMDRWACIGEAAVFADPYYSPGISVMSFGNSMVTDMIAQDIKGQLTPQDVKEYSDYLIRLNDWLTLTIQSSYGYFHHPMIMALSTLWDIVVGWSFVMPDMFNSIYLDRAKRKEMQALSSTFISVIYKMNEFLLEWGERTQDSGTYEFIDYLKIPFVAELYKRNTKKGRSWSEIVESQKQNLKTLEEFSHVIFLMAVRDVMPETLDRFPENCWLKIDAMSLDKDQWDKKDLFNPSSEPRDYAALKKQIEGLFAFKEEASEVKLEVENPFSFKI